MNPSTLLMLGACTLVPLASAFANPSEENRIAYLPLANKGLRAADALAASSKFTPKRPRPPVRYLSEADLPHPDREGSAARESVLVQLKGRSTPTPKDALVSFGFPFKQGALYRLSGIRVVDAESGKPLPLQAHALTLWGDGSIKSALLNVRAGAAAQAERELKIEFGHEIRQKAAASALQLQKSGDLWRVDTGKITVTLSPSAFTPPGRVTTPGKRPTELARGAGLTLTDENGKELSSHGAPLDSLQVERSGALDLVLRAEGPFASGEGEKQMRQITRLRFQEGSGQVEMTLTLVNDALAREFTDIRSLVLDLALPATPQWSAKLDTGAGPLSGTGPLRLTQWEDTRQEWQNGEGAPAEHPHRATGAAAIQLGKQPLQFAFKDFWQRWPKGVEARPGQLRIALLPAQTTPLEKGLPVHLQFPFVEGHYRTKWGTSFTERLVFDFTPENADLPSALSAAVQTPAHVVIPPAYLASTGVFASLPTRPSERLSRWNAYADAAVQRFIEHRDENRATGYLNWGDWFGERERNWGNNEYDIPHSFFIQYLISGDPKFLDLAQAGVRHQADVDLIHAYPDPFYIGGNVQHSIGHSGISYQKVIPKTWTYLYDGASAALNGHTWADGMADCWLLTGDPVVMEALLAAGEHIRWAATPSLKSMGNHHRSVGWSSQAAAASYRATSDPEYLEGLRQLIALPLGQWDPQTGIWPYPLHPGHTGGREGLVGASVYNMGILLMGISKYHELTGDPQAIKALDGAAAWLLKCWSEERAWPYAALADGKLFRTGLSPGLNPLIYPALTYAGKVTGNEAYLRVAAKALDITFAQPIDEKLPKNFSIKMYATPWAISLLELLPNPELP